MRSDMKKVVVERPRWGSRGRNRKFGARLRYVEGHDYEEQPKKALGFESYRGAKYAEKEFTDVLNPLERFLRSSLGRPWNKIYSELCAGRDKRKATSLQFFRRLENIVATNCYFDRNGRLQVLIKGKERKVQGFYVHPVSGLLCEAPVKTESASRRECWRAQEVTCLYLGSDLGYRKQDGIWYRVKWSRIVLKPEDPRIQPCDVFLKRKVHLNWGVNWVAIEKKQCNREELKELKRLLESGKARSPKES